MTTEEGQKPRTYKDVRHGLDEVSTWIEDSMNELLTLRDAMGELEYTASTVKRRVANSITKIHNLMENAVGDKIDKYAVWHFLSEIEDVLKELKA